MADHSVHQQTGPETRVGNRYVLLGELGRGGMASVHRAHDEVLDRTVAVKLLHPHLAHDPAFLERFRREARAAAALSHPNVVGVHDWGEGEAGAYLVLQLVDGLSLREMLDDHRRLTPGEALAVLGPAAAGLAAAHASGLVHRDVKPENLLIGRDGTVRVTDFGLARAAASATSTFGADVLVGSPHYLSPEAVHGSALDARADVYALGVVLFECLVGEPPHEGDSPFTTALRHTTTPVPAPSERRGELSSEIDDVVALATAIDREERLPDAAAFARMLRAAVREGTDALPRPGPPPFRRDGSDPAQRPGTRRLDPADASPTARAADRRASHGPDDTRMVHRPTEVVPPPPAPVGGRARHDRRPYGSRRRGRGWLILLVLVALVGGSALGGYLVWDRVLAPVTSVPVVLGAAESAAVSQLTDAGFEVTIDGSRPHDAVIPAGHVMEQRPDEAARRGTTVTLVLSAGPAQVEIPEVTGVEASEAADRLREDGLEADVAEVHDEEVAAGLVLGSDPPSSTIVSEGTTVTLRVSLGPAPREVPSLTGLEEQEARELLADTGLELAVERRTDPDAPAGTILSQDVPEGTGLSRGDAIGVVVSEGPAQAVVPSVRGEPVAEAVAALRDRGFEVEVERRGGFGAFLNPDRVYDQDPAPDSVRDVGDTVLLYAYDE